MSCLQQHASRLPGELLWRSAMSLLQFGQPCSSHGSSSSQRAYATAAGSAAEGAAARKGVRGRSARYGSRLSKRDPERFQRMRALLGYYDDLGQAAPKIEHVTINTLQTMRYTFTGDSADTDGQEAERMRARIAAYKVTTLNRRLGELLDKSRPLLDPSAQAADPGFMPSFLIGGTNKPAAT